MFRRLMTYAIAILIGTLLFGCAATRPEIPVEKSTISPGGQVTRGGSTTHNLLGEPISVGDPFPPVKLVDKNLRSVDISGPGERVTIVSIVPSLDTQVCEQQTHLLGEAGEELPPGVRRVSISRDLPFAQKRFADETGFDDILFLSDYQQANFGQATGLLVDQIYLLARSVMVVDRQGVVRYMQVVPEIAHLPDMQRAFQEAEALLRE